MKRNRWSSILCAVDGRIVVGLCKPVAKDPARTTVKFPYEDGEAYTAVKTSRAQELIEKRIPLYI